MRKWVLLALAAAALAATPAWAADLLSHRAFRDAVIAEVRKQAPQLKVQLGGDDDSFTAGEGDKQINAYTGNAYLDYAQDPAAKDATIAKWVRTLMLANSPLSAAASDLRVAVRPRSYFPNAAVLDLALARPLAGDLVVIIAVDTPEAIRFPPAQDLRSELKMTNEELWSRALANSRAHLPRRLEGLNAEGINLIQEDDGYAASILADDDLWRDADKRYPEGLLVAAPERNTVLILRRHAATDVDALRTLAKAAKDSPQKLSDLVLTRKDGRWIVVGD